MEEKIGKVMNENEETVCIPEELLTGDEARLEELYGIPVIGIIPRGPGKKSWFRRRKSAVMNKTEQTEDIFNG